MLLAVKQAHADEANLTQSKSQDGTTVDIQGKLRSFKQQSGTLQICLDC